MIYGQDVDQGHPGNADSVPGVGCGGQDVRLWRAPDHTRIVFDLSGPADHKLIVLENPSHIVLVENTSIKSGTPDLKLEGTRYK